MTLADWRAFATPRIVLRDPGEGGITRHLRDLGSRAAQDAGRLLPGPGRDRLCDRQVARCRAVRRPALDGDEDRRPRGCPQVRRGDPCRVPGQDARLQPVTVVQLGHNGPERRRDAALPRGPRKARLRVQLHHLRRPPDRRPRGRGVRHGAARGRDARPGAPPAQVPAARISVSDTAVPRRRRPTRCRPDGRVGANRGDQGDGQGLDAASASRPDRGADTAARGMARGVGDPMGVAGEHPRRAAAAHGRLRPSRGAGPR